MTINELRAALEADGWHTSKQTFRDTGVDWYAWRRLAGAADCSCNEKPPSLIIIPYEFEHDGLRHSSVQFEVCGEAGDRWLKLQAYSVKTDEAITAMPRCADLLRAAWNAAVAVPLAAQVR